MFLFVLMVIARHLGKTRTNKEDAALKAEVQGHEASTYRDGSVVRGFLRPRGEVPQSLEPCLSRSMLQSGVARVASSRLLCW